MFIGCGNKKVRVALSYSKCNSSYAKWVKSVDHTIEIVSLRKLSVEEAKKELATCDGVIFTGGEDVSPSRYGKAYDSVRCEINYYRDTLEFALIKLAMEKKMPIIGVCRGEQILNVAMGGSLIVDIPSDLGEKVIHRKNGKLTYHKVMVDTTSLLYKLSGISETTVNSAHHQGINRIAESFRPVAYAQDSLIEAVEWKNPEGKPFFMAVQWHPERLGKTNKLSYSIVKEFVKQLKEGK